MNPPASAARLRWFDYPVALLPLALVFAVARSLFGGALGLGSLFGGALGLAIGPAACALNLVIMQSPKRRAVKYAANLGIAAFALVLWAVAICVLA